MGQPLSSLPKWLKIPIDVMMQIVEMKTDPEKIKNVKQQEIDTELWDTYFGGIDNG